MMNRSTVRQFVENKCDGAAGSEFPEALDAFLKEQKFEALGELIGGVAHDCNNLLGGILAHAEAALADPGVSGPSKSAIEQVKALTVQTSEIVRELMVYAGQESSVAEPLDLSALTSEMVRLLSVIVPKGVSIQTRLGQHLPVINASAPRIRQVLLNLIVNASEAMSNAGGLIDISTRRVVMRQDSVLAGGVHLPPGDYVVLKVTDNGRGMSRQTQARAFGPFFTTKHSGRGLGLSVVQDVVCYYSGAIGLESAPGRGTTFQVFLPSGGRAAVRRREGRGGLSIEEKARTGISILMVEDEEALLQAIPKMLRKEGFDVFEASEGDAAVELFRTRAAQIDVVLLDLTLPGTSSRYVIEQMRRIRPEVRIVLTTAYSRQQSATGFDGRFSGFIRKPYQLSNLIRTLRAAISA